MVLVLSGVTPKPEPVLVETGTFQRWLLTHFTSFWFNNPPFNHSSSLTYNVSRSTHVGHFNYEANYSETLFKQ